MKGTWSGGSLVGDPEGFVEKALETGISSHRSPTLGNLREGLSTGDSEMDERGSMDELPLSLKRLHGGGLGRISFTGDPRKYFRKVAGCGHLSLRGPLFCMGNSAQGGSYAGDSGG